MEFEFRSYAVYVWHFSGSGGWLTAFAFHCISNFCAGMWWSFVIAILRVHVEIFAESFKFAGSFTGIVRPVRLLISIIIPNINRCVTVHIQFLTIGSIFWPIECALNIGMQKKCHRFRSMQLNSVWNWTLSKLPFSWDTAAPLEDSRMWWRHTVGATLSVGSNWNGIVPNDQSAKIFYEYHLHWLYVECCQQTLAADHSSEKID